MKIISFIKEHAITALLTIFVLASAGYQYFPQVSAHFKIAPYLQEVKECYNEAKGADENNTIGLDYGCAIDVAASIYNENPDLAVEICDKFSILPGDSFQQSICEIQIEKKVEEQKLTNDEQDSKKEAQSDSETENNAPSAHQTVITNLDGSYESSLYSYSFQYPSKYQLTENSNKVTVMNSDGTQFLKVRPLDPEALLRTAEMEPVLESYLLSAEEYAQYIYKENNSKDIFGPYDSYISGKEAKELWVKNQFCDALGCKDIPYDSAYFYLENELGILLEIQIPMGGGVPEDILASLKGL